MHKYSQNLLLAIFTLVIIVVLSIKVLKFQYELLIASPLVHLQRKGKASRLLGFMLKDSFFPRSDTMVRKAIRIKSAL